MCVRPANLKAKSPTCRSIRRKACCAAVIFPGAKSVPWKTRRTTTAHSSRRRNCAKIYLESAGVKPGTDTVVYCRIGERSSHTWFVLTYLLGLDNVRNYDGSWTEWGNKVGAPIEKGA